MWFVLELAVEGRAIVPPPTTSAMLQLLAQRHIPSSAGTHIDHEALFIAVLKTLPTQAQDGGVQTPAAHVPHLTATTLCTSVRHVSIVRTRCTLVHTCGWDAAEECHPLLACSSKKHGGQSLHAEAEHVQPTSAHLQLVRHRMC